MIIYILNGYFPDSSGFGRRCQREIEALSELEEVVVICRRNKDEVEQEKYHSEAHAIEIVRYSATSEIVHRPDNYTGNGWYEIKRNLDIMIGLTKTIIKTIRTHKKENIHLYAVTSPLTVPLLTLMIAKLFRVEATLVSFHDLEPELAMHLKNIPPNHWIVRIELFLEWLVCKSYKKILVTTEGQAEQLVARTRVSRSKILAIPNSTDITQLLDKTQSVLQSPFSKGDFVLMYMSTLSFGYTTDGFIHFLAHFKKVQSAFPTLKMGVIGGGEGLAIIEKYIEKNNLQDLVHCFGFVKNPAPLLQLADSAIIPWEEDIMTKTMLPTKLFEYLSLGIPVIAPNFGEFERVLQHKKTALLYNSLDEAFDAIQTLIADRNVRKTLGLQGEKLYNQHFTSKKLAQDLLSFITQT